MNRHARWNLYWVSSDGEEDCFVVARNSRSATRVDADYCGFEARDAATVKVRAIPEPLVRRWDVRRKKEYKSFCLPWYADKWLLRQLGARFRERKGISEALIDDVVYTSGGERPERPRLVGKRFIEDVKRVKSFQRYGHEDRYTESQMSLFTLLGICVARCQEIEKLIANSFIFGAISPKDRNKNFTIAELIDAWERRTLGQMIRAIEGGYDIEPTVHAGLRLFLDMRNRLVHGFTTSEQFDIHTAWGQDEIVAFLYIFELMSRPLREAFEASLYASVDIGNTYLRPNEPHKHLPLTKRQKKKIGLFAAFFTPRNVGNEGSRKTARVEANTSMERMASGKPDTTAHVQR